MSKLEQMAYKLEPAGHEEQPSKRKYVEPERKLATAFEAWLSWLTKELEPILNGEQLALNFEEWYKKAESMLGDSKPSPAEANLLPLFYEGHKWVEHAGIFISAVYNRSPDKLIIFDIELEKGIRELGYKLSNNKTLINTAKLADDFGIEAEGAIINCGLAGIGFGARSSGVAINLGLTADYTFAYMASGIIINCGTVGFNFRPEWAQIGWYATGTIITTQHLPINMLNAKDATVIQPINLEKMPTLSKYVKELKEIWDGKNTSYNCILDDWGPEPAKKIQQDIEEILERCDV